MNDRIGWKADIPYAKLPPMRLLSVILLISLLGACASKPPLLVRATGEDDTCTVQVNGLTLSNEELDERRLRALATAHGSRLIVDADHRTPYKCIGGTIFKLQRAGFRVVSVRVNGVELPRK